MSNRIAKLVLFDLDGTLLDSALDLHAAMLELLVAQNEPPIAFEQFRPVVSKGARAMLKVSFPARDDAQRELLVGDFLAYYQHGMAQFSSVFSGIELVLKHIEAQGSRWGIVTNKPFYLAEPLLQKLGWDTRSAILIGGDSLPRKKPDPDQLLFACEQLKVDVRHAVYVGDDERDIQASKAAGMRSVAALWGYRPVGDDPLHWNADALAVLPEDLLQPEILRSNE